MREKLPGIFSIHNGEVVKVMIGKASGVYLILGVYGVYRLMMCSVGAWCAVDLASCSCFLEVSSALYW